MRKKGLLLLLVILVTIGAYQILNREPCKSRISYQDIDLNRAIDLDELFREPSSEELAAIRQEWQLSAWDTSHFDLIDSFKAYNDRSVQIIAQQVEGNRHYGAVILPKKPGKLAEHPVLVIAFGLDQNDPTVNITYSFVSDLIRDIPDHYYVLIPSYRGQRLKTWSHSYCSDGFFGDAFDGAATDALALLDLTIAQYPGVDTSKMAVFGVSRGATVALLMGERKPAIAKLFTAAGPYNFLAQRVYDRYGLQYRYQFLGQTRSLPAIRKRIIRSSPVYFTGLIQADIVLYHGDQDEIVPVWQALTLTDSLRQNGLADKLSLERFEKSGHRLEVNERVVEQLKRMAAGTE